MAADEPEGPSEEDVRAFLESIARTRVADVVLQTAFTLSSVASARLGVAPETQQIRDLGEARAAIDVIVALLPFLQAELAPEEFAQLRQTLAGLQMAYGQISQQTGEAPPPPPPPRQQQQQPPQPPEPPRPKIWTPRGDV
jgi:Domain of unknown function (DUF1844)